MSFDEVIFTLSVQDFTLGQLLVIPATLFVGFLLIHWLARLITNRLAAALIGFVWWKKWSRGDDIRNQFRAFETVRHLP